MYVDDLLNRNFYIEIGKARTDCPPPTAILKKQALMNEAETRAELINN